MRSTTTSIELVMIAPSRGGLGCIPCSFIGAGVFLFHRVLTSVRPVTTSNATRSIACDGKSTPGNIPTPITGLHPDHVSAINHVV